MSYTKTITPSYETIGRRQNLTGFIGQITDESGVVLHSMEYGSNSDAETALNAITYDLLMDLTERGLSDAVPDHICQSCGNVSSHWFCPECNDDCNDGYGPGGIDIYAAAMESDDDDLLADIAHVLDMALGSTHGAASVVAELQRIRARIGQVQGCTTA